MERSKPKLFALIDHTTKTDQVQRIKVELQKVERSIMALKPTQQLKLRREFMLQALEHVAEIPGMEGYQAMGRDRLPKPYHNFQAFINQSATEECQRIETADIMVDWNVPIKIRLDFLPDQIM